MAVLILTTILASSGEIVELEMAEAYPLGMRFDSSYQTLSVQLEPGDRVVFYSNGFSKAINASEEAFGFERLPESIRKGCEKGLLTEGLVGQVFEEVRTFIGDTPQGDDLTMVALGPDPRDERINELEERVRERTQELEETHRKLQETQAQLISELEEELQTAHELQMGLMPMESPQIEGFDISGRCIPFNHVGGDFFQYFQQDGKLSICLADVTGHAMEAAVPVMMFSGVLKTEMRLGASLDELFGHLNRTMQDSLDSRTYVCFSMGELDVVAHTFRLANAACPYPFRFRVATGDVEELQVDGYPLGVRAETAYTTLGTALEPGDYIVFCSDGIIEAANTQEDVFGFEQTAEMIRAGCAENLSAEELLERMFIEVQAFIGDAPQGDDMTVVVLKVEG